jgi:hypothetical protein
MMRFSFACLPLNTLSGVPLHLLPAILALTSPLLEEKRESQTHIILLHAKSFVLSEAKRLGMPKCLGQKFLI